MKNILSLTTEELKEALSAMGEKPFREKQITRWLQSGAESFDEMTDLSVVLRQKLAENFSLERAKVELIQKSSDGTQKFLLSFPDGEHAECVFMKYSYGNSLCISTQIGCDMGCKFCASGLGGKVRDLSASEMLDEFIICQKSAGTPINHIVLMGMGEPLSNYKNVSEFLKKIHDPKGQNLSYRNITLSTCGLIPGIKKLGEEFPQVNLAVSLHAANQQSREKIMPIAKTFTLDKLIPACKEHAEKTGRRVTFEYALILGQNDSEKDAAELIGLLRGLNCHVNLIPLNPVKETGLNTVSRQAAHKFAQYLEEKGIPTTVRRQLGADIDAACGQLRKKHTCSLEESTV